MYMFGIDANAFKAAKVMFSLIYIKLVNMTFPLLRDSQG